MVSNTTSAPRDSIGGGRHGSRRAVLVGHRRVEPLPHRQRSSPPARHHQSSTQK
ncbi:hypothetical protein AAG906_031254 [Vitis piasezkii]